MQKKKGAKADDQLELLKWLIVKFPKQAKEILDSE